MAGLVSYHCLAPDFPGHGASNSVRWRSLDETTDLIVNIIERHVPSGRAHVVGLSLGGAVAHNLLARRPDLVDRMLIDGSGVLPWWGNGPFLMGIALMSPLLHTRPVVAMLSRSVGGIPESDQADIRICSRHAFRHAFSDSFGVRLTRSEVNAPCPTLLVAGEKEHAVRSSHAALAELMPHATAFFVPGTGHGWLGMKNELHQEMVRAWLADEPLPAGLEPETMAWPKETVERLLERAA